MVVGSVKNAITITDDNTFQAHIGNRIRDMLVLDKGPEDGLDDIC